LVGNVLKVYTQLLATLLGLVLASGCASPCHHFAFQEISPGLLVGCRPRHQSDFDALRKCGIRTIISFEAFSWHVGPEQREAERNRFTFRNAPVVASPFPPSEKDVNEALRVLSDQSLRPAYVHCLYGRDRAMFVLGLYEIYFQGATPQDAWNDMLARGFKHYWTLRGFEKYFWAHTRKPEWVKAERLSR
jgi:hypothetical protein